MKIREHVDVIPQPTVVRLEHLQSENAQWVTESYYLTDEIEKHLEALRGLFAQDAGSGIFLIGHYGSGKSHFLAYLTQQLRAKTFAARNPAVVPISLLNYRAEQPLESILEQELQTPAGEDRRQTWMKIARRYPAGLLLVFDELSEYLRSKPPGPSFNEDLRFLQFLGEWAQDHRLWILAALQEQIEHTGEIEYALFRKIKDRYPLLLLLTPSHVRDLIAHRILRKKSSYRPAVEQLASELKEIYPGSSIDYAELCDIYPLHPATLELLDELRDRFSQARGMIDFTLTQLLGNKAKEIPPFLDQPWGRFLTPDAIVDHFADLFEIQPQFLPIAQKVLPQYRKLIPTLFETKAQQELAWSLLKLLILVHLSPRREFLQPEEAALWLLYKVSAINPEKNREVVRKSLETLARHGSSIKQEGARFRLDLEDDSKEYLDTLLSKALAELRTRGDSVFESLVTALSHSDFNPFSLPRDRWHARKVRWHFHEWDLQVYFGGGRPPEQKGLALQIGLPWGPPAEGHCYKILPARLDPDTHILELAALHHLKQGPLPNRVLTRINERIGARLSWFASLIRNAYVEAAVLDPEGIKNSAPFHALQGSHAAWLNTLGEWMLRQIYPLFERFAPGFGPLPKEAYRQFMKFASEHDIGAQDAPDFVKLIREAYLVPMGLMQRRGSEYVMSPKLEGNELVRLLVPILDHHPTPARVYQHLSMPVYGLVADQIHLLLLVLLIQGELDITKGEHSYREIYDTLPSPLQYDKVLPGTALNLNQLRNLQTLCEGFRIPVPKQWSVLTQKRAVEQLRKHGSRQRDQLSAFVTQLKTYGEAGTLLADVEAIIAKWLALEKGDHELQGFQHFEHAAGSIHRFVVEANEMASLPQRFERLLRETQRFRHLFSDPIFAGCSDPDIATRLQALSPPPSLAEPEALEDWLNVAQALYRSYQVWYRSRHEEWRNAASRHPIWSYRMPAVARSRHLMLAEQIQQLENLLAEARVRRCAGMTSLDFQPACRCGFDGADSPLSDTLRRFEAASQQLENELSLFFQQDKVKSKVREWVNQGVEMSTPTLSYVEGRNTYPEVEQISLFDQHLSGLELAHPVDAEALMSLIGDQVWEKAALMKALDRFFERTGPRVVLRRPDSPPRKELVRWCYEQALRSAMKLPPVFSRPEQALAAELIDPSWVSGAALHALDELELGEEPALRILDMLLKGLVRPPEPCPTCGPAAAALDLMRPSPPTSPGELAARVRCLYEQHARFVKLRPQQWLAHLDGLAGTELTPPADAIETKLHDHIDAQWIVVDCLGLPLIETVRAVLAESLPQWKICSVEFALVSMRTSTDAFYRSVLDSGLNKTFEKIDAIDKLIHERKLTVQDLERLARAELQIAFKQLLPRLDPTKPVLVFGDHGFRLSKDGREFTHGGPSTLERMTAVFDLR